jgi:helicase
MRFIALSATIPNAEEIARWLGAKLIQSDWRPVPLREGVYHNGASIFNDGTVNWTTRVGRSDVVGLALETVKEGGQALIFVSTRKSTEAVSRNVSEHIETEANLKKLSRDILGATREPTRLCKKLSEHVERGVAFHHAGINYSQRKLIEDAFRGNMIKVIAATTTLAMGMNLPSRRVIIRDWLRYESGMGMRPIPTIEIKQMFGRAGRPKFDSYGEAIIVAKNKRDEKFIFDRYIKGRPEEIYSQLGSEPALRTHILASIAGAFTRNSAELLDFLRETFCAHQRGTDFLSSIADNILEFLEDEGMIKTERGLVATRFGRRVSELYIDPHTGVVLRDALERPEAKEPFPVLHMIARTSDMMHLSVRKSDFEEMLEIFNVHAEGLLLSDEDKYPSEDMLSEIKTASVLMQWIMETTEDRIVSHFGIGPGDLHTLVDLTDWLLYSAAEIGKIFDLKDAVKSLSLLRPRVIYGVRNELLELVSLRGIGRVRARNLFDRGYKRLKDVEAASAKELSAVPNIGKSLAEDIKRQAGEED